MKIKLLSFVFIATITACTTNINADKEGSNTTSTPCKDPRPQICTMNYQPVCGLLNDNQQKTFSNGCAACSDSKVKSYAENACQANTTNNTMQNNHNQQKDVWLTAKLRGVNYRAIGQEPAWLLEVVEGKQLFLSTNYSQLTKTYAYVEPKIDTSQHSKEYQLANKTLIKLENKHCIDVMSGEKFTSRVTIQLNERVLKGCGRYL